MPAFSEEERDIHERLSAPFPPEVVQWRPGQTTKDKKKAQALAYIDARDVQNRLDDVLGFGWESEHFEVGSDHVCCRITITLPSGQKVSRTDGCWVGNVDVAPNRDGKVESKDEDRADREAKWALSDAMKRAAVKFGVGKYLYDMPSPWVEIDQFSKIEDKEKPKLAGLAAAPFNKWKSERSARARGQQQGGAPARPQGHDAPRGGGEPQRQPPPREREEHRPEPPGHAPPPRAQDPRGPEPDADAPAIERWVWRAQNLTTEQDFKEFVGASKDMFAEGTPERRAYAAAVKEAARKLGIRPKAPPGGDRA
jgi:hypothetical protein